MTDRPPPVTVDDRHPLRSDTDSDEMRRVHPDLPGDPRARLLHQERCDWAAYRRISERFPSLTPPGRPATEGPKNGP